MKKSVYSLMLFDEIVEKIDQTAYENFTNRSQLINDILADYLGLMTPEQKIQVILEQLDRNFSSSLSVNQINRNTSIQFGKSLKYKYRPKVKYSYEFAGAGGKKYAVLKISSRTKSSELNDRFIDFFKRIDELELRNDFHSGTLPENESNHKFVREFRRDGSVSRDVNTVSRFLTNYLKMVDQAMNLYFSDDASELDEDLQRVFDKYLKTNQLQIVQSSPLDLVRCHLTSLSQLSELADVLGRTESEPPGEDSSNTATTMSKQDNKDKGEE